MSAIKLGSPSKIETALSRLAYGAGQSDLTLITEARIELQDILLSREKALVRVADYKMGLAAKDARLSAAQELAEAATDAQWGRWCERENACPSCYNEERLGHAKDCKLAAALAKFQGTPFPKQENIK